jgi:DNA (cytosine-5)-methyltransferase 1
MLENVPALANDERLARLARALHKIGYETTCEVVDASKYGVPQRRRRMLFLASRIGPVSLAQSSPVLATVREFIGSLPKVGQSGDPLHDHGEQRAPKVAAMISRIPKDGGSRRDLPQSEQLACHIRCDGFYDIYGRMAWDAVAPTITSGCVNPSKGRFLHPEQDRTITLREAALLQTFPADHHFSLRRGKYAAAEMIGNGLPPELVRRQAVEVAHRLDRPGRTRRPRDRHSE